VNVLRDLIRLLKLRVVQLFALTLLLVGVGTECFLTKLSVLDPDMWWHMSVGGWILQNHAFPHNGIFSRTAANHPWMAYSWGYEVLLSRAYDWLSFIGMGLFGTALTVGVSIAVFWMVLELSGRFWAAWALSIAVYSAFLFNIAPRPLFFTSILFAITLTLLLKANRSGRVQYLYWLPLIFLLWANFHIQFIYGLAAIGLLGGISLLQRIAIRLHIHPSSFTEPTLPVAPVFAVLAGCVLASCIGPYTYHLYEAVLKISSSKIMYTMISELQSLSFQGLSHFAELLLAGGAFFALGWQKKLDPFKLALLAMASIFAFRTTRDAWFLSIVSAAMIADFPLADEDREPRFRAVELAGVGVAVVLLLLLTVRNTDFDTRGLDRAISSEFPVDAVNFLRKNPIGGPIYNSFDWGGFLIFYMPQYPVSMDGRTDLYGNDLDAQYYSTQEADPSYVNDPSLNEAGVVLLKNKFPIAKMLPLDHRFRVIYKDEIATLLARNW